MHAAQSGFQPSRVPIDLATSPRATCRKWRAGGFLTPLLGLALLAGLGSGCTLVPVSVGNPIPGMTTVAVAPFFNLSAEPSVDGRRFALAYYSELQKTSNYQVIPVGIVEAAIQENELNMSSPADAVKLARILEADAVVVGAVTDYNPYYPPQLAAHIRWFSPREWMFYPGLSTGEEKEKSIGYPPEDCPPPEGKKTTAPVVRGQSAGSPGGGGSDRSEPFGPADESITLTQGSSPGGSSNGPSTGPIIIWPPGSERYEQSPDRSAAPPGGKSYGSFCLPAQPETIQPIMSYTRYFDGADQKLIQLLKGYYVLRGDMRSGGWEAYLHRSDDFLQFASHVLVLEMLELHGGPLKTQKVLMYGR
jgi:hypothetical protein